MLIIKKYPNRRLYDTSESQYVNLDHIKRLVVENHEFQIHDSKTGEDLTNSILLQIISESEASQHQSLLTNGMLKQLIRFYGSDMQGFVRQYLEQSMANFIEQQDAVQRMMRNLVDVSPLMILGRMVERNMDVLRIRSTKDGQRQELSDVSQPSKADTESAT